MAADQGMNGMWGSEPAPPRGPLEPLAVVSGTATGRPSTLITRAAMLVM